MGSKFSVKLNSGRTVPIGHLSQHLVPVHSQGFADIGTLIDHDLAKKGSYLVEVAVGLIIVPSRDKNAVVRLQDEVVRNIVDNDRFLHASAQETQVFREERPILRGVLAVQAVLDVLAHIDLVNHLVCVLFERGCENHDFVILGHCFDKLNAAWPHKEVAVMHVLHIVNQSLVEVQNERVNAFFFRLEGLQKWRKHFRQVCEVIRKLNRTCNS